MAEKRTSTELFLAEFDVYPDHGFLPKPDPIPLLRKFGGLLPPYDIWEDLAQNLPKFLPTGKIRLLIYELPVVDTAPLQGRQNDLAMLYLSFLGHAFKWTPFEEPAAKFSKGLAVPWYNVSKKLGRPPVLSYASYALFNWHRINLVGPIEMGNIAIHQNFLGGLDEDWFILIHIDIEAKAGPAIVAGVEVHKNKTVNNLEATTRNLSTIAEAVEKMYKTLLRMPEGCDEYIYYNRVRPYIHGFTEHPVIYEGVEEYGGKPQYFFGETGAQSSIIPFLDAVLGLGHDENDKFDQYLLKMRDYMPPKHRKLIELFETLPSLHEYVLNNYHKYPRIRDAYNECINWVIIFLEKHLEYAARYIHKQHQANIHNPTAVGTGGTPFMEYLKKHTERRKSYIIA